jgi:hypothetical protein
MWSLRVETYGDTQTFTSIQRECWKDDKEHKCLTLVRGDFVAPGGALGQCVTVRTMIFKRSGGLWVINGKTWESGNEDQVGRVRR